MRLVEFLVGATAEGWSEFRTHRARVLMSLIGVAIAVLALTGVTAVGQVAQQSVTESLERQSGRPALLSIQPPYNPADGSINPATADAQEAAVVSAMKRYGIRYWSRTGYGTVNIALPAGPAMMSLQVVDVEWATMRRQRVAQGSWFRPSDADRLAPAIVIDTESWKMLGSPELATHPTVRITGPVATTAVVIGVVPGGSRDSFQGFMLPDPYQATQTPDSLQQFGSPTAYEAWVPPSRWKALRDRLASDLSRAAGDGAQVDVSRQDYAAGGGPDPLLLLKIVVGGAAGLLLLLAALGLVTISMVTVQGRVREIGIRRSFGATAGRVFFGVMMESVVATAAAGVVGVILAVLALKNPWVTDFLTTNAGLLDVPAFPFAAALTGLLISVGVGALAGLLPAIVAVRVKPIDAIRY